jgi:hypothetical protein
LSEFVNQVFKKAEISESEDNDEQGKTTNESKNDIDAFDYVPKNMKNKK